MSFQCGIVGLPNVGKSTIFNAITRAGAQSANYPFCTIEPNTGRVNVPDSRLEKLAQLVKPQKTVPAYTEFVDIAGLVEGASKGEGLGNKFLAHIRETQAIAHIVRCFEDDNIVHVRGKLDPISDIEIINTELALADLDSLERQSQKLLKQSRSQDKEAKKIYDLSLKLLHSLEKGEPARQCELTEKEAILASTFHLITMKPVFYVLNMSEDDLENGNDYSKLAEKYAKKSNAPFLRLCGSIEEQIVELDLPEQVEYLQSMGLEEPGLNRMVRTSYAMLNLITYFTAGVQEVRAWTIPNGSLAPEAAGVIHTDMCRGFIRAEVISYDDFIKSGSEAAAKDAGKMRLEGKEYMVKDGDIMHFRFNV